MEKDLETLPEQPAASAPSPNMPQNELYEKHVFSDEPVKPSERSVPEAAPAQEAETIAFDKPTVLDSGYAARSRARQSAASKPADRRTVRPRPQEKPQERPRRKPPVSRPAAPARSVLISGETPTYAIRRMIREFCVLLLFVLLVCGGFMLKDLAVGFLTDNTYSVIYQSTVYSEAVKCSGVSLETRAASSGYTAAQAVCTKLGSPITDSAAFSKEEAETLFPSEVTACMEYAISAEHVQLKSDMTNRDLLMRIHESLSADKPVIVLLAADNAGQIRLQYAVVTAMDAENDTVTVSGVGSGTKTYTTGDFLAATRFETYEDMPFTTRLGLTFGSWSRNTAIFVE